jgi:hypothetical protein
LTSCQNETINALSGCWEAKRIEAMIGNFNMNIDLAEAGMKGEVTFNDDGTGVAYLETNGNAQSIDFTYELNEDVLTYNSEIESGSTPVSFDGNHLTVELNGTLIGQPQAMITVHLEKK